MRTGRRTARRGGEPGRRASDSQGSETPAPGRAHAEDTDVVRDIGTRIQRYRLSRYAAPVDRVRRRLRWAWLVAALWLVWVGVLSEHNFVRLWQLGLERRHSEVELRRLKAEVARLDAQLRDPQAQRSLAEHALREQAGMAQPGEIIYRIGPEGTPKP